MAKRNILTEEEFNEISSRERLIDVYAHDFALDKVRKHRNIMLGAGITAPIPAISAIVHYNAEIVSYAPFVTGCAFSGVLCAVAVWQFAQRKIAKKSLVQRTEVYRGVLQERVDQEKWRTDTRAELHTRLEVYRMFPAHKDPIHKRAKEIMATAKEKGLQKEMGL